MEWSGLKNLSQNSLDAVKNLGFEQPTKVQYEAIPLFLSHKDVVVQAITGSGKTMAFLLPMLEILIRENFSSSSSLSNRIGAIILSPTRELARQTGKVLEKLSCYFPPLTKSVITGGVGGKKVLNSSSSIDSNQENFNANIIIATPGRLEFSDFVASKLEILILDEADHLLSMGFKHSIQSILSRLPKQRRTGLFSATMNEDLEELVAAGLRNPIRVTIDKLYSIPDKLEIYYILLAYKERLPFLVFNLAHKYGKIIAYFGTCASVDYFGKVLETMNFKSSKGSTSSIFTLHGKMDHKKRVGVYEKFIKSQKSILLCTDLTARGLDFQDIDLVVQIDPPQDPASIIHRCGRTARSGRSGSALIMLDPSEAPYVDFLKNKKMTITEWIEDEKASQVMDSQLSPSCNKNNHYETFDLHSINMSDRDFHDKSIKAFVSYLRHYKEHYANFIFDFKNLNIQVLADAFGLFRLPKMMELKAFDLRNLKLPWTDTRQISYKDEKRETARQLRLEKQLKEMEEEEKNGRKSSSSANVKASLKSRKSKINDKRKINHQSSDEDEMKELEEDWKSFKRERKEKKKLALNKTRGKGDQ